MGPTSKTVSNNGDLFSAFKALTTNRANNRGTLDVVKSNGKVVELKCSQHHFFSGSVKVKPEDASELRNLLKQAVDSELERAELRLLTELDVPGGDKNLVEEMRTSLENKMTKLKMLVDENMSIAGDTVLRREDIKKVVEGVENLMAGLRQMSVEKFLESAPAELYQLASTQSKPAERLNADQILQRYNQRRETVMTTLGEIAPYAFADAGGDQGGDGFVAIVDGKPVNFLIGEGAEKDALRDLPEGVKKVTNQSTQALREKLLKLADVYVADEQGKAKITQLLAKNDEQIAANGGLDLLSCKNVASAIKEIAQSVRKEGIVFSCDELEVVKPDPNLSMKTVVARAKRDATSIEILKAKFERTENEYYQKCLNFASMMFDDTKRKAAADRARKRLAGRPLVNRCNSVDLGAGVPAEDISKQYKTLFCGSTNAAIACEKENKKPCVQVFADGHFCGCGIFEGWGTQEETLIADDPELQDALALLYEEGEIEESLDASGNYRLEYKNLSTIDGGYILDTGNRCYAFHSMPSMSGKADGIDLEGNVKWLCLDRELATGIKVPDDARANAKRFVGKLLSMQTQTREIKLGKEEFRDIMTDLVYGRDQEFNIFAEIPDDELATAVKGYVERKRKNLTPKQVEAAEKNFVSTVGSSFAKMAAKAHAMGAKAMVIGASGLGTYNNKVGNVAKAMQSMRNVIGDTELVYADIFGSKTEGLTDNAKIVHDTMLEPQKP